MYDIVYVCVCVCAAAVVPAGLQAGAPYDVYFALHHAELIGDLVLWGVRGAGGRGMKLNESVSTPLHSCGGEGMRVWTLHS